MDDWYVISNVDRIDSPALAFYPDRISGTSMGSIAFSPIAQGMLTDKYLNGIPEDSRIKRDGRFLHASDLTETRMQQIKSLNEIAKRRGQTLAQMALNWILRDETVASVLIGASRPQQILDNLKIVDAPAFTTEELEEIEAVCRA